MHVATRSERHRGSCMMFGWKSQNEHISFWRIIINAQRFRWLTNAWKLTENIIIVIKWAMLNSHTYTNTHKLPGSVTSDTQWVERDIERFSNFLGLDLNKHQLYINEPLHILCEQTTVKSIPQNEIYSFDEQMNIEHCVNAEYDLKTVNMS